ncbi:nickel-dependent hydrogenase large subunit [Candidatus Woesearchaeota archaeon]|nr:nickel-dependent hydrogenase large subunit [Candidatus Woesearchaeota archaeon]
MHDFTIPVGPQHSSMKEPMCLRVKLDGNTITDAWMRLGYVHRGLEKILENKTVIKALYIAEHTCGICSFTHSLCFIRAVEGMLNINAPKKVNVLRVITAELERVHSHLLWFGFAMHEIGFDTLFQYAMRERESILEVFERITGNRVHHSFNKIGSVRYDLTSGDKIFILEKIKEVENKLPLYFSTVTKNKVIHARLISVGIINQFEAKKFGLVGPFARGSGVKIDVRKDDPYAAYKEADFELVTEKGGDAFARLIVRLREIEESIKIVKQMIKALGDEPIPKPLPSISLPNAEGYGRVEAPRGENFHFYRIENSLVTRGKIKTPTFINISVIPHLLKGKTIGDIPVILSSLDPCFGCMERIIVVKNGKEEVLKEDEFRYKYC